MNEQVESIRAKLQRLRESLVIPAAEYVPAIPDAWTQIDDIARELDALSSPATPPPSAATPSVEVAEMVARIEMLHGPATEGFEWHVADRGIGWEIHTTPPTEGTQCWSAENRGCACLADGFRETVEREEAELIVALVNSWPAVRALLVGKETR